MKSLLEIFRSSEKKLSRLSLFLTTILILAFLLANLINYENQKNQLITQIQSGISYTFFNSVEEQRFLDITSEASNSFEYSIGDFESPDICGIKNCYKIDFTRLQKKKIEGLFYFLLLVFILILIINKLRTKVYKQLVDELSVFNQSLCEGKISTKYISQDIDSINKLLNEKKKLSVRDSSFKRIMHDLRSPLEALKVVRDIESEDRNGCPEKKEILNLSLENLEGIIQTYDSKKEESITEVTYQELIDICKGVIKSINSNLKMNIDDSYQIQKSKILVKKIVFVRTVTNLLNNALEATENDPAKVNIRVYKDKQDYITIAIADKGFGMSKDQLRIATRGGYTSKTKGTGIGLSSSIENIQSLSGEVDIQSEVNLGTTIKIRIPLIGGNQLSNDFAASADSV
jgi:signal transduction histidine kinase